MGESKLWEALDYLREHGWCKYRMSEKDGRVCARGALFEVGWLNEDDQSLSGAARDLFPDRVAHHPAYNSHAPIVAFNNHPDTVFEDVETVFEKAAIRRDEILA